MRVLLADDEPKVRSALRLLLEQVLGLTVVGEAVEAQDLLSQAGTAQPDLVLLDWELPNQTAAAPMLGSTDRLVAALRSLCPRLLVVALSGRPEARGAALAAGASAFVCKGDPPEWLLATLSAVGAGGER